MTTSIRQVVLTEVVFILVVIAILASGPHPTYAYVVAGLLGLAVQALAIVSIMRVVRRQTDLDPSLRNGEQLAESRWGDARPADS